MSIQYEILQIHQNKENIIFNTKLKNSQNKKIFITKIVKFLRFKENHKKLNSNTQFQVQTKIPRVLYFLDLVCFFIKIKKIIAKLQKFIKIRQLEKSTK